MTMRSCYSVVSVKELNQRVKDLLVDAIGQVWLVGEISNFSKPASGHWYFTLKDDCAQVRCAMFRSSNFRTDFLPENGQKVLVQAAVTLYEARGEYQLVVENMQTLGVGLLQQKFEELKQLLQEEGIFASHHKKSLPAIIRCVGIITSSTGAVIHDICQILKRREPSLRLIIYPTRVQGDEAAAQIAKMITIANRRNECDVLIVARGGGSIEDLWPFNEESVARTIFASKIPIVSAVGHEIDFTIADFVADVRAATPSVAAEIVSKNEEEQLNRLKNIRQHLFMAMDCLILQWREQFAALSHRLSAQHPELRLVHQQAMLAQYQDRLLKLIPQQLLQSQNKISNFIHRLISLSPGKQLMACQLMSKDLQERLNFAIQVETGQRKHHFALLSGQLCNISPLKTLSRGYTMTFDENQKVIVSSKQAKIGQKIITQLKSGKIISQVIAT